MRRFTEEDFKFLEDEFPLSALEMRYHGDVVKESAFTLEQSGSVIGVLYFKRHYTWYYGGDDKRMRRCIVPVICAKDDGASTELIAYAVKWLRDKRESFGDMNVALAAWENADDYGEIERYLRAGFIEYEACPCFSYDIAGEIPQAEIPEGMTVRQLPFDEKAVKEFIAATKKANNGIPDSEAELWFMTGEPSYRIFVLMDGEKIVSSASVWRISDERAAVENIFTSQEYRRRGLAKAVIHYALKAAKDEGFGFATLSLRGRNIAASRLYQSIGFKLYFNQIELLYPLGGL